ncbi:hypothetical protein ASZ90_002787 [hydrocarbon metagenome]|uniref:Uncharacterized protein n=1 Tax=hydrocarbon metagenome TaxID=938273 RepID=A0A0W8G2S2_9ZZZZ
MQDTAATHELLPDLPGVPSIRRTRAHGHMGHDPTPSRATAVGGSRTARAASRQADRSARRRVTRAPPPCSQTAFPGRVRRERGARVASLNKPSAF